MNYITIYELSNANISSITRQISMQWELTFL